MAQPASADPLGQHLQALGPAAPRVGRGVEVHHQVGPGPPVVGDRTVGGPHVLADRHPHQRAADAVEGERPGARGEPALLVEDAVVGQQPLVVDAHHPPAGAHGGGVGQRRARRRDRRLVAPGAGSRGVAAGRSTKPTTATQSPVAAATSSRAATLSATKPGFKSRSSGGYPVTASSGKTHRSAPAASADARAARIRSTLPSRSPTTVLSWAAATAGGTRREPTGGAPRRRAPGDRPAARGAPARPFTTPFTVGKRPGNRRPAKVWVRGVRRLRHRCWVVGGDGVPHHRARCVSWPPSAGAPTPAAPGHRTPPRATAEEDDT